MRTAIKRIAKLEERFGSKDGGPQHLAVIRRVDVDLETDRCVGILRQCGFLSGSGVVNFCKMPAGLIRRGVADSGIRHRNAQAI